MELEFVNVIDVIQHAVDKICKQEYKNDKDCPPRFIVSQYDKSNEKGEFIGHEIVLTIKHMNSKRTRTIFPKLEFKYGYEPLKDEMKWLYNSTM